MKKIYVILFSFVISLSIAGPHEQQLKQINSQISSIKQNLDQDLATREKLQQALQDTETAAGKLNLALHQTAKNLSKQKIILTQLQATEKNQNIVLQSQQEEFAKELRSSYILGRITYLKLLFNQQDPSTINRVLIYDRHITEQRLKLMAALQTSIQNLENSKNQISNQFQVLTNLQNEQQTKQQQIISISENRRALIHQMSQSIQNKNQKLNQLLADKHHLEQVLAQLQVQSKFQTFSGDFAHLQGKLSWPVTGRVINSFGTQIEQSELRWTGTLIGAAEGTPVRAVAEGKVVFAKWFSGYGLMVIIYHGNGFMTLYGRNQYLYKHEGDVVHPGEVIAAVGETGGFSTPALYFAIRHNADPLNPAQWCHV